MRNTKAIYFDMDGTVANLYNRKNWLADIRNEERGVFENLPTLFDMKALEKICTKLQSQGWTIGIITWLPMGASDHYEQVCTIEKQKWAEQNMPYITEFYAQSYGKPKQDAPILSSDVMFLIDDNAEVRNMWDTGYNRESIDPTDRENPLFEILKSLLD